MTITRPEEKKKVLMSLIDDMTAAAIDRSSQGYSQFLHCRGELLNTIDSYMKEDARRLELAMSIAHQLNTALDLKVDGVH